MDLSGKRVSIVGLGASGIAAAKLCVARGAIVGGFDESPKLNPNVESLVQIGVSITSGALASDALRGSELVVISPGVPPREAVTNIEAAGCAVISEVELASRFLRAPIAVIGGTNGKSTVTALCHQMLERSELRAFIGGNYGTPVCEAIDADFEAIVVELSSFQAERVPTLRPKVHALLNITEDHLDRYPDFEAYAHAKGNPFANMTVDDVAVIPLGDALCAAQAARGKARVVTFSITDDADVHLDGEAIATPSGRVSLAGVKIRGRHNLANACAAIAVAQTMGASPEGIRQALIDFAGLPHRHALVAEIDGVRFYDDSKATNVGAAVAALEGLDEDRAVLIAGGRDKLGDYAPLVKALGTRGRALVVVGEAADRIAKAAEGVLPIHRAESLSDAVRRAAACAVAGDAVLLSPACSSYDMFNSFKARGTAFAAAVAALGGDR